MLGSAILSATRDGAIGGAVVLFFPGREIVIDVAGVARDDPTYTRGALCKFDDELAKLSKR